MSEENKNNKMQAGVKSMGSDIYVVANAKGDAEFYESDPLKAENRKSQFDFGRRIFEIMDGPSDFINPIKVRVLLYQCRRGAKFDFNQINKVCGEGSDVQIGDKEGNIVEITKRWSTKGDFPYNGVIYNEDGVIIDHRLYSTNGECSDGDPNHSLIFVKVSKHE